MHPSAAARKHLTAWLALLAMWLVVGMPAVSQVLASRQAREPVAELCSGSTVSVGQQGHHAATLAQCGYCDFPGMHPAAPSLTAVVQPWLPLGERTLAAPAINALIPIFAVQSGHPRDPPRSA